MASSENAEIRDLIDRTFVQLGGRATKRDVQVHVQQTLPRHLADYLIGHGLGGKVGEYFRSTGSDNLPTAPEVDDGGTHAQLELLDEHEFRYVISRQMKRSKEARRRAIAYARLASERLGVVIDVNDPFQEQRSA